MRAFVLVIAVCDFFYPMSFHFARYRKWNVGLIANVFRPFASLNKQINTTLLHSVDIRTTSPKVFS